MPISDPINALVLQEFRLHAADTAGEAARIVAAFSDGIEPAVPLLASIDDGRDVATVRALHAGEGPEVDPEQRVKLDRLVASWQPVRRYDPRLTERSASLPSSYRLAVTESGINDAEGDSRPAIAPGDLRDDEPATPFGLMWIGSPLGTHAGLLVLLGSYDDQSAVRPDPRDWPLPLSAALGVRIYQSQRMI